MRLSAIFSALLLTQYPSILVSAEPPPARTRTATVFGEDACPVPQGDEIIVCGRLPETERYRIPKQFREKPRDDSGPSASWASKVRSLEDAQRFTMPGSCTVVGSGGQSGCTQAMLRQWFLERKAMQQGGSLP